MYNLLLITFVDYFTPKVLLSYFKMKIYMFNKKGATI